MNPIDSNRPFIIKVRAAMSTDECAALMERIESLGPTLAPINTPAGERRKTDVRNNERVMFDDLELASVLMQRIQSRAPADIHGMALVGANERFRGYRYQPGMRFAAHSDGSFHRDKHERSCYSCLLYLNDDFEGGATTFFTRPEVVVQPEQGMVLMFQHPLVHEGSLVTAGVKYVCRSDLMYRRV